jgi:ribosomal protein S18 acetylase RimI-like enzyme
MNLADLTLRLARETDAVELAAMSRDLIEAGLGWHYRPRRILQLLADTETVTLVACAGGEIAGFAIMTLGDERAHLVLLAVRPEHQRRRIARRMTAWLVETALVAGIAAIDVEVRSGNVAAQALYRDVGFVATQRLPGYYRGRETAIRMTRRLRPPALPAPGV